MEKISKKVKRLISNNSRVNADDALVCIYSCGTRKDLIFVIKNIRVAQIQLRSNFSSSDWEAICYAISKQKKPRYLFIDVVESINNAKSTKELVEAVSAIQTHVDAGTNGMLDREYPMLTCLLALKHDATNKKSLGATNDYESYYSKINKYIGLVYGK